MPEKRGINAFNSTGGADGAIANRVMWYGQDTVYWWPTFW
jgi:hypothetical protein